MSAGWLCLELNDPECVHALPLDDLIQHEATEDCVCAPETEAVFREDGSNSWLLVHHSLDGREANEDQEEDVD